MFETVIDQCYFNIKIGTSAKALNNTTKITGRLA